MSDNIFTLSASELSDHPLLAHIPEWRKDEPEFEALCESIRERGQDYEVLVDNQRRIIDGRNRRNACAALKIPVRCREVLDAAAPVIVASLLNRRHLTKSARAYLAAPLFVDVLNVSQARRIANLKQNRVETPLSGDSGPKTAADVAARLGIGHTLFEQALELRRLFEALGEEARLKYEPRILGEWQDESGEWQEPVGLGYMINGLKQLARDRATKRQLGKRAQHDRLFIGFLPKLGLHWKKASAEQKDQILTRLKSEALKWPEDMRDGFAKAIRDAAKAEKA